MERTLAILKPDCQQKKLTGKVIDAILAAGFNIIGLKMLVLKREQVEAFYEVHRGKPFYVRLIDFMLEGPVLVAVLEKNDAVQAWRKLMGCTNPADAETGTIRHAWAETVSRNIVHGSDAVETAEKEITFFFSKSELL
ncbi:MAG: nucleoside-diphosphate kinase [Calditrichaeota bacterium]|nr:MAG: nucleoside-diphosphate kinase [Calditrichota bacterium]